MAYELIPGLVRKEQENGKRVVSLLDLKLGAFEKKYKLKTSEFVKKFEAGKLGDEEDYFEWLAVAKGRQHWLEKLKALTKIAH